MAAIEWSWSQLMDFMIRSAQQLEVSPIVKYSALSLFADRFFPSLTRYTEERNGKGYWLLQPIREGNLQLFALISLWISSKMHDSRPVSVKSFKSLGDKIIEDEHFTTHDFLEAEIVFMQVLDFEIGTSNIAFLLLEELLLQFKGVAKFGELVSFEACMDLMDLLYEKEETMTVYRSPRSLAASILIASYLITVPKQRWEFPILPWVEFVTSCKGENIVELVQDILKLVFEPRQLHQS